MVSTCNPSLGSRSLDYLGTYHHDDDGGDNDGHSRTRVVTDKENWPMELRDPAQSYAGFGRIPTERNVRFSISNRPHSITRPRAERSNLHRQQQPLPTYHNPG